MAVIIGSARGDERGAITGGQAGDQTGREVTTENWYLSSKGWRVLRAKNRKVAERIAWDMQAACDNNNIGYDQSNNQSLFFAVEPYGFDCSKAMYPVETDCSQLVRVCVCFALNTVVPYFYTGDEADKLLATGAFVELGGMYATSSDYLKRGDILVTKTKGHTVVVLTNGSKVSKRVDDDGLWGMDTTKATQEMLGTYVDGIVSNQRLFNKKYLSSALTSSWKFRLFGKGSEMVKALQTLIGTEADGIMGKNSVIALQKFLQSKGYILSADGYMGKETVRAWQRYLNEYFYEG